MPLPTITIVSPTLTGNALFRTDVLRRLLARDFEVQIVAFGESDEVYGPLADVIEYRQAPRVYARSVFGARALGAALDGVIKGDAVVCVKPLMHSYGAALLASRRTRRPILLDIDDWEPGFLSQAPYWEMRAWGRRWVTSFDSPLYTRLLDGFIYKSAAVMVSNSLLQGIYGGHWVPHVRDHETWQPGASQAARDSAPTVFFGGAPRGHKGLPTLLAAWKLVRHRTAVLDLVVPDPNDEVLRGLLAGMSEDPRVRVTGPYPFDQIPRLVGSASVVVIPQDNAPGAVGQLPAKLIDAMAAGRAIIATDVGDATRWLADGAGLIVPPGTPQALADAIDHVLEHPADSADMGAKARRRFLTFGSVDAVRPRLVALVQAIVERKPLPPALPVFADPATRTATER
jgi:glycosyltransferase involved in cell wall biosynthesis